MNGTSIRLGHVELFAGYGGLGDAVNAIFDAEYTFYAEFAKAPSAVMAQRLPDTPNEGDVTTIDWSRYTGVGIVSGGSPCQDVSGAGRRAGMTEGTRSNLWVNMREAIAQLQPEWVVWENVRGAYSAAADSQLEYCPGCMGESGGGGDTKPVLRALARVLGDLSDLRYCAQWRSIRASDVGACHHRDRVFVLARRLDAMVGHPRYDARSVQRHLAQTKQSRWVIGPGQSVTGYREPHDTETREGASKDTLPLLPTPDAYAGSRGGAYNADKRRIARHSLNLQDVVVHKLLPTPAVADSARGSHPGWKARPVGPSLNDVAVGELLPTPRASDHKLALDTPSGRKHVESGSGNLPETVGYHFLPTPTAAGSGNTPDNHLRKKPGRTKVTDLNILIENDLLKTGGKLLPTPKASDGEFATPSTTGRDSDHATHLATRVIKGTDIQGTDFGDYEPAIRRAEAILGRPVPAPTQPSPITGNPQLSPRFVEWMMMLPDGHVTGRGLSRSQELTVLGAGVVPLQGYVALAAMKDVFDQLDEIALADMGDTEHQDAA